MQENLDAEPTVFLDPNTFSDDGTVALRGTKEDCCKNKLSLFFYFNYYYYLIFFLFFLLFGHLLHFSIAL